jgi:hypothetical protein
MLLFLLASYTYAEEISDKGLYKDYQFKQFVKDAKTLYLPMNEGNVNIQLIDGNEIVVNAQVSALNTSQYSKNLLGSFNLTMAENYSHESLDNKIIMEAYLGDQKIYPVNNEKNMCFVMENNFRWNDYGYDRSKAKIIVNYDVAIPIQIENIILRTKDGQVNIPSEKLNDIDISLYKSTLSCGDINAASMSVDLFNESSLKIDGNIKLEDSCNIELYDSSYGKVKNVESDYLDIELYSKSKLELFGATEVSDSTNIDIYNSELMIHEESSITSDNLMIETYDNTKCNILGDIKSLNTKIENFNSTIKLSSDNYESETLKIEACNKAVVNIESVLKASSMKLSNYSSEISVDNEELISDSLIIEAFAGSKMKINSDFTSVNGGKIELYGPNAEIEINSHDTLSSKLKGEVYSKGSLIIDGEKYK